MGSVPDLEAGQPQPTHGVTRVQAIEALEERKPVILVVAEVREVAEGLRPAMSVVAGGKRVLLVDLARVETNVLPVIGARRAGTLPRAALAVRGVRGAAPAVPRAAEVEDLRGAVAVAVAEQE